MKTPLIPGNEYALNKLRALLASGEAIAFAGAGASAELYPVWTILLGQLANEAVSRGLASDAERQFWLASLSKRPQQVARGVSERMSPSVFASVLRDMFSPRRSADGKAYTRTHGALMRLPFKGFVTTNYDHGLLQARMALRENAGAGGIATWKDADSVQRWYTRRVFQEHSCPVLFAHGAYDRGDTVILDASQYRKAYASKSYRRLIQHLWTTERLVFVGFGFSDPFLDFVVDEILSETTRPASTEARHIAFVGLEQNEIYTPEIRRAFQDAYSAELILYPISIKPDGQPDHSALNDILESLAVSSKAAGEYPAESDDHALLRKEKESREYIENLIMRTQWHTQDEIARFAKRKYIPDLYVARETERLLAWIPTLTF